MRVLISGGGSGGHVYPALAVVEQLVALANEPRAPSEPQKSEHAAKGERSAAQFLWIGTTGRMEQALVERAGLAFRGIDTGQVRGINPLTALANGVKMVTGVGQSRRLIATFQPAVCLVTGGYVCAPVVAACRTLGVPVLIYLPDLVPGWAIRSMSRLADRVAVTFPAAAAYFGGETPAGKAVVTGYPVRQELLAATGEGRLAEAAHLANRACVRQQLADRLQRPLGSPAADGGTLPLLLVWGGSQGSRNINRSVWAALSQLLPVAHILHVVGERDWPLLVQEGPGNDLTPPLAERYHPVAYLHEEMALALAAADLSIARAGASSLGEFPLARLPAILAPLLGVNQLQNAIQLAEHGAAVIVDDDKLSEQLATITLKLLRDAPRRRQMEAELARLAQPAAARNIAQVLVELAASGPATGRSWR